MSGYNVLIPDISRSQAPHMTLPIMDALQKGGQTPVVMEMHSIASMYNDVRYVKHGCYSIFSFYVKDLLERNHVDFGFCVGLGLVLEDSQKGEMHHLLEESGVPSLMFVHGKDASVIDKLEAVGAAGWKHSYIACTSAQLTMMLRERGIDKSLHIPLGVSGRIFYPADAAPIDAAYPILSSEQVFSEGYEVSFAGGYTAGRAELLKALAADGVALALFGDPRWRDVPELRGFYRQQASYLSELNTIHNLSQINLDLPDESCHLDDYLSSRIFDCSASQGFLLSGSPGAAAFLEPEHEIALFGDADELVEAVRYYLPRGAERRAIAAAARKRVMAESQWSSRLASAIPHLELHLLTSALS